MENRRKQLININIGILFLVLLLFTGISVKAETQYKIEQVFINMPDVVTYYRCPQEQKNLSAYLGGEELTLSENKLFSETGEGVEYYILVDISGSIPHDPGQRFGNIQESLMQFRREIRENDRMILLTFGNEVTTVLNGDETPDQADAVIKGLVAKDSNTVLFEAIDTVAEQIVAAGDVSGMHRVVVVISDGKDCADYTRNMDSVQNGLTAKGIPIYSMAVENNEGDSENEISNYRGKFGALSRNTGGVPWAAKDESVSVMDGLNQVKNTVMSSYRAQFAAASNRVSNTKQDFVLEFPDANNRTETVSVLVKRSQSDAVAPQIAEIKGADTNSITVTYSEAVDHAAETGSYKVKLDGKTIPVQQVVASGEPNGYELLFGNDLKTGDYTIDIIGVTDRSNEKNALENASQTIHIDGVEEPEPEPEPEPEEEDWKDLLKKYWPFLLVFLLVLIVLIVLVIVSSRRKNSEQPTNSLGIDEVDVSGGNISGKGIVKVHEQLPTKKINLWISNGIDEPKCMDLLIQNSCIIGRSKECDVYCDDPMMSRQHFALELEAETDSLFVMNLQSTNGTAVNGVRINERYKLENRDEIEAGSLKFRVEWV